MLKVAALYEGLGDGDWVVVRPTGEIVDMKIPKNIGPATFIVGAVTDAVKTHEGGMITGSLDRDTLWTVEAFALNRVVVRRLEGEMTPMELYQAVLDSGLAWQVDKAPLD